jgi:hypothetical protein
MVVVVDAEGEIEVREREDLARLMILDQSAGKADIGRALARASLGGARAGEDHFWLSERGLLKLASPPGAGLEWLSRWTSMVSYGTSHGWTSDDGDSIKVHVVRG